MRARGEASPEWQPRPGPEVGAIAMAGSGRGGRSFCVPSVFACKAFVQDGMEEPYRGQRAGIPGHDDGCHCFWPKGECTDANKSFTTSLLHNPLWPRMPVAPIAEGGCLQDRQHRDERRPSAVRAHPWNPRKGCFLPLSVARGKVNMRSGCWPPGREALQWMEIR